MQAPLDVSSEFNTIDHSILVHRLHTDFGFTDTVLQWHLSYLIDRSQYVSLSNKRPVATEWMQAICFIDFFICK